MLSDRYNFIENMNSLLESMKIAINNLNNIKHKPYSNSEYAIVNKMQRKLEDIELDLVDIYNEYQDKVDLDDN
jgi:hypothetical protein